MGVEGFAGGCNVYLKEIKKWADSMNFKHPHVSGRGGSCKHYGVYVVSPNVYVDDPYSMGLVTFSQAKKVSKRPATKITQRDGVFDKKIFPDTEFSIISAYGVQTKVTSDWGSVMRRTYYPHLFRNVRHNANRDAGCEKHVAFKHNCIKSHGHSIIDTCIEHTAFFHYRTTNYYE